MNKRSDKKVANTQTHQTNGIENNDAIVEDFPCLLSKECVFHVRMFSEFLALFRSIIHYTTQHSTTQNSLAYTHTHTANVKRRKTTKSHSRAFSAFSLVGFSSDIA